jgi:hypothetical protein
MTGKVVVRAGTVLLAAVRTRKKAVAAMRVKACQMGVTLTARRHEGSAGSGQERRAATARRRRTAVKY